MKKNNDKKDDFAPPYVGRYPDLSPDFIHGRDYVFERVKTSFLDCSNLNSISHYTPEEDDVNPRKIGVRYFRDSYIYGSVKDKGVKDEIEQKTCIWPGGIESWEDKSSGTMWLGVHGTDSVCVVTRSNDLDTTRLTGSLQLQTIEDNLSQFRKSAIVELEDLADSASETRSKVCKSIKKPFGVVSVIPYDSNNKKSRKGKSSQKVEYGKTKAIEFLQEKLNSGEPFTVEETIRTAIVAFGHLIQNKLQAEEIQVSVVDPTYMVDPSSRDDPFMQNLTIKKINEHLAAIKKLGTPSKRKSEIEPHPNEPSSSSRRLRPRKHQ